MIVLKPIHNLLVTNERHGIRVLDRDFSKYNPKVAKSDVEFYLASDKYIIYHKSDLVIRVKHLNQLPWAITHLQQFEFKVIRAARARIKKYH